MVTPKNINFSNVEIPKVFHNKTKQYSILNKMEESVWKDYTKKMATQNIKVIYDGASDVYIAKPLNENQMPDKKLLLHDEDESQYENMDSDILNVLDSFDNDDAQDDVEVSTTPIDADVEPSIGLSQFESLLLKVLNQGAAQQDTPSAEVSDVSIASEDAQEPAEFVLPDNILDTEFDTNDSSLDYLDSKIEAGSYIGSIDPTYNQKEDEADDNFIDSQADGEYEVADSVSDGEDFTDDSDEDFYEDENEEILEEDGEEFSDDDDAETEDDYDMDDNDEDGYDEFSAQEEVPELETDDDDIEAISTNGTANINGTPVQIILTGVMITPQEVTSVFESAKSYGFKLKAVKGAGKHLNFIIESNSKQYTIVYEDLPKYKSKTPFSIKNYKFTTLDEALKTIDVNKKKSLKESKNFKSFMNKDTLNRNITGIKEATILKDFEGKINENYVSGWNLKSVGNLNLKTGINETYSNITEHSRESNTLVKTTDGQFFLVKGNLKERSAVGTKKQLVDLQGKKDFGLGTVVGLYENNVKGLGQIMFKIKRTSLPLLTWR